MYYFIYLNNKTLFLKYFETLFLIFFQEVYMSIAEVITFLGIIIICFEFSVFLTYGKDKGELSLYVNIPEKAN